jgi:hypothetical protein
MPIALGAFSKWTEEEIKNVGLIYEHLNSAGPRSINGMPNFFSLQVLNQEDTKTVFDTIQKLKKAQEEALNEV